MEPLLYTGLFLPLIGFLILLTFSGVLSRKMVNCIGPGTICISFLCFVKLFLSGYTGTSTLFTWIPINGLQAHFSLYLDHLSLLMTLIITGVGFLIHAYSCGYMDHDKDFSRYFAVMNFFIFSMLLLVLASNILLLFVGWEGVGVASYLLIGFWYTKPAAQRAAKKAFVVNRIGDLGLLLGIFLTYNLFGTGDMQAVCTRVSTEFAIGAPLITLLCVFYFWGASGKSAQMPLHTWLPDAMEGPTPVSALIHAATMVTAGVYLVVRMSPVFEMSPTARMLIAIIGGTTSLFAALCATSQTDVKRVLAYSTLSQLGLMFLATGFGAYFAAMFHLTMHAFCKALLFLAAGNVIHMLDGTTEMAQMGGLSRYLKKTNILFLIGVLSMAGIPPLAIFFSKDLLLEEISSHTPFYILGLLVSILTAFYLMRAYMLTFQGQPKIKSVSDAPKVMWTPVAILGVLSIFGGFLGYMYNDTIHNAFHLSVSVWISIAIAFFGVALGMRYYNGKTSQFLYKAFYINELYNACIVGPLAKLSSVIATILEPKVFDASMQKTAGGAYETANLLQKIQNGQIRSYISWIVAGSSLLILYFVIEGF
ncbi:MAG: NADH-quinone oxidoreductase subunit L [Chlamydiales bacterium]|nr:NADH-quinone oxidoreductase subunit L [Chlamydiales bacterium]